jgi:hypothetical protein
VDPVIECSTLLRKLGGGKGQSVLPGMVHGDSLSSSRKVQHRASNRALTTSSTYTKSLYWLLEHNKWLVWVMDGLAQQEGMTWPVAADKSLPGP